MLFSFYLFIICGLKWQNCENVTMYKIQLGLFLCWFIQKIKDVATDSSILFIAFIPFPFANFVCSKRQQTKLITFYQVGRQSV